MKRQTRARLNLERATIRILEPRALRDVGGGLMKSYQTECSGSCQTCAVGCDVWTVRVCS